MMLKKMITLPLRFPPRLTGDHDLDVFCLAQATVVYEADIIFILG